MQAAQIISQRPVHTGYAGAFMHIWYFTSHYLLVVLFLAASSGNFTASAFNKLTMGGHATFWRGSEHKQTQHNNKVGADEHDDDNDEGNMQHMHTNFSTRGAHKSTAVASSAVRAERKSSLASSAHHDNDDDIRGGAVAATAVAAAGGRGGGGGRGRGGGGDNVSRASGGAASKHGGGSSSLRSVLHGGSLHTSFAEDVLNNSSSLDDTSYSDGTHQDQRHGKRSIDVMSPDLTGFALFTYTTQKVLFGIYKVLAVICVSLSGSLVFELLSLGGVIAACAVIGTRQFVFPTAQAVIISTDAAGSMSGQNLGVPVTAASQTELTVLYVTTFIILAELIVAVVVYAEDVRSSMHTHGLRKSLSRRTKTKAHRAASKAPHTDDDIGHTRRMTSIITDLCIFAASICDFYGVYGSVVKPLRLYKLASSPTIARVFLPQLPFVLRGARAALPALLSTIVVYVLLLCVCAVQAMRAFGGRFSYCVDAFAPDSESCVGTFAYNTQTDAGGMGMIVMQRAWVRSGVSFDDVWTALRTLSVSICRLLCVYIYNTVYLYTYTILYICIHIQYCIAYT